MVEQKAHAKQETREYCNDEENVLQRLSKLTECALPLVPNKEWKVDDVVKTFEILAPKIQPELGWTADMQSRKANGPSNVMKTLKACSLDSFLSLVAIKRVEFEHNRRKILRVLEMIAAMIEDGFNAKTVIDARHKNAHITKLQSEETAGSNADSQFSQLQEIPSPFKKKEKLRIDSPKNHKVESFFSSTAEQDNASSNIPLYPDSDNFGEKRENPNMSTNAFAETDDDRQNLHHVDNDIIKKGVPTPFRSSRPREIGEHAAVHVITSPSRTFLDMLERTQPAPENADQENDCFHMSIPENTKKSRTEGNPTRKKNETVKPKKAMASYNFASMQEDPSELETEEREKNNYLVNRNKPIGSEKEPNADARIKESVEKLHPVERTPKDKGRIEKRLHHASQGSPIVRACDPTRGVTSWMKARQALSSIDEEISLLKNHVDISLAAFRDIWSEGDAMLLQIERRLDEFNDILCEFREQIETSLQDVNQRALESERLVNQSDVVNFIKGITEEYSSPSIQSVRRLEDMLDEIRQKYFQMQNLNALSLVLYSNDDTRPSQITWTIIQETLSKHQDLEGNFPGGNIDSEKLNGLKEMTLPKNILISTGKRLEKLIQKSVLYREAANRLVL